MALKWVNKRTHAVVPKDLLKDAISDGVFHASAQIALSVLLDIPVIKKVGRPRKGKTTTTSKKTTKK